MERSLGIRAQSSRQISDVLGRALGAKRQPFPLKGMRAKRRIGIHTCENRTKGDRNPRIHVSTLRLHVGVNRGRIEKAMGWPGGGMYAELCPVVRSRLCERFE